MTMLSQIALLVYPLLLAFAASSDLLTMRISNRLVLLLVVGFFALALVVGLSFEQIALHIACATIVLVVTFTFFAMGWVGGGDAKLAAATALWLGFDLTLPYLLEAAVLGGLLTFAILAVRRFPLPKLLSRIKWVDRLHDAKSGVPYGIALAAAGILVYSDTTLFQRLVG